jgi:hypothetical protein
MPSQSFCSAHVALRQGSDPPYTPVVAHLPYAVIYRNNVARSCRHCGSGKAVSVTYSECVFVALGIQHVMRERHIVICGLTCSTVLFHIIS